MVQGGGLGSYGDRGAGGVGLGGGGLSEGGGINGCCARGEG